MFGLVVGDNPGRIWGFSSKARSKRLMKRASLQVVDSFSALPADEQVLVLNADYVFESAFVEDLTARAATVVEDDTDGADDVGAIAAAVVTGALAPTVAAAMRDGTAGPTDFGPETTPLSQVRFRRS